MDTNRHSKYLSQRGMISLLAAGAIVTGLMGLDLTMELGDKMVLKQALNNHAQAIAPVVLRAELALTKKMIEQGEGDKPELVARELLKGVGLEPGSYELTVRYGRMVPVNAQWTDPKTGITLPIREQFVPCDQYVSNGIDKKNCADSTRPKANVPDGEAPVGFSAVSIEIKDTSGILNFHPVGRALYGLPAEGEENGDLASCFCNNRFNACLKTPLDPLLPQAVRDAMGQPDTQTRKNYCDFGLAPAVSVNGIEWSKYPTVPISAQWLGKTEDKDQTGFIRKLMGDADLQNYERVKNNLPLQINKSNPFPNYFWNFFTGEWDKLPWDKRFYALTHDKNAFELPSEKRILNRKDIDYHVRGEYDYKTLGFVIKRAYGNGWFYVGRKGTCVAGTTAEDVPHISATVDDPSNLPSFDNNRFFGFFKKDYPYLGDENKVGGEIQRCLSYKAKIGNEWATLFGVVPIPFTHRNKYAYFQNSCVDFARQKATRVSFFQWMVMNWTWPFIDWERQYQALDCTTRKMRWYGWFHWGYWREQRG